MKRYALGLVGVAALSLALAACGSSPSTTSSSNATFTTVDEYHAISPGAPYNPYNSNGNTWLGYDQWQLAWFTNSVTNPNNFIPGLAASWTSNANGTEVTIKLQPNAKWSNGQPVTAQDVKASFALAFTQGNAQAFDLGQVNIINSHTVQFKQLPGDHYNLFLNQLLQQTIVPASEFAPVLPKNVWSIIDTAQYAGNNSAKLAQAKAAANQLTALGKKVSAYAPPKSADLSAGAFVLKNLNPGEAILMKNPDFYDARNVKVNEVVMRNYTGNQQIWNYLEAGQLDFGPYTAMPVNILHQILKTKGNQKVVTPAVVAAGLAFDENIYPYNMVKVRQALAYVINRKQVQTVGEGVSGIPAKYQTGMIDLAAKDWLSPSQLAQLKQYRPNIAKATALLKSAGFKKVNGNWMMPNGKPWTMTIYTVNGFSDWIAADKVISTELTNFGIPTSPDIVSSYAQELKDQSDGKYAVSFYLDALGPMAQNAFNMIYGTADGYQLVGTNLVHYPASAAGKGNFIDLPAEIPTLSGKMINPGELTHELTQMTAVSQERPIVQELMSATNANLPVLNLWNYANVEFINTSRFSNFPVNNLGLIYNPAGVWMQEGYVVPRK
ncbi:ABC transporter substrate-binding protein [Sulfobacillus harzensis]|uniref:ABC transporter substrate-binding protein n=1 Tax=Sulfobacillus harzensis TaxID=2729629 RepID=A0A7Y0L6F4_9FIRM|nr:ABC transporter substrate-binding protein [Sulfobacillus harzensis]NMP24179.1 ABC transporter substrate-binding protein [Sulfobacillus harzensis]